MLKALSWALPVLHNFLGVLIQLRLLLNRSMDRESVRQVAGIEVLPSAAAT